MTTEATNDAGATATNADGTLVAAPAVVAPVVVNLDATPPTPAINTPAAVTDTGVVTYEPTGDAGLDYALGFVGRLGFTPDSPAMVAAAVGNFDLLRAELAAKGDKAVGYDAVVNLAKEAYDKTTAANKEQEAATAKAAVAAAGSPERWAEVQKWASSAAEPHEKAEINAAFAKGGLAARMAADYLVRMYDKSAAGVREPKPVTTTNAGRSGTGDAGGPLTAKEYSTAVQELSRAAGGRDVSETPAYRSLQQRRLAGQRAGK